MKNLLLLAICFNIDAYAVNIKHGVLNGVYMNHGFMIGSGNFADIYNDDDLICKILYPKITNDDMKSSNKINDKISKFVDDVLTFNVSKLCSSANLCKTKYHLVITDSIINIKWSTKRNDKLLRIDALNFARDNNSIIKNVFASHVTTNQMNKYFNQYLSNITWDEIERKIDSGNIQFYCKEDGKWYIVFNSDSKESDSTSIMIPNDMIDSRVLSQ